MRPVRLVGAALGVMLMLGMIPAARAASPEALCRRLGTDDRLRPIPASLVPAAKRLFGLQAMPERLIAQTTWFRCFAGRVLVCNTGANLPCGKADTSRRLPAAETWCAGNPGSDFIPLYVTGHDSIYRWRCSGAQAATIGRPLAVDPRGFVARFWKPVAAAR